MRHGIMSVLQTLYRTLRLRYPSGRFERLDFRGERENQMRHGIMSVLQTLYHDSLPDSNICSLFPKRKGPVSGTLSLQEEMIVNQ